MAIRTITAILLVIGGLNWGLVGIFQFNLVATIFGDGAALSRIVYSLVGLSALYQAFAYPWGQRAISEERQDRMSKAA